MPASRERGVSVAAVVRDAIDRALPSPDAKRGAAGRRILAAEPIAVPDLVTELDDLRARRA
jgi:hypothetical protein